MKKPRLESRGLIEEVVLESTRIMDMVLSMMNSVEGVNFGNYISVHVG